MGWFLALAFGPLEGACSADSASAPPGVESERGSSSDGAAPSPAPSPDLVDEPSFPEFPEESSDAGTSDDRCFAESTTAEARKQPIDIVWAIDTSSSMQAARDAIQEELNVFSERITGAGIDVHTVLLAATDPNFCFGPGLALCVPPPLGAGQCGGGALAVAKIGLGATAFCASGDMAGPGADSLEPQFLHLNAASGETMQPDTILAQYPAYKHLLRPEAHKHFVVTSDGDGRPSAQEFENALAQLDPPISPGSWTFNGVFCQQACLGACTAGLATTNYPALVAMTSGVDGNLCDGRAAFTALFDRLATAVIVGTKIECEWTIPPPPSGQTFDKDKVNVSYTWSSGVTTEYLKIPPGAQCGDLDGWQYDDEDQPTKVLVCPHTCAAIQGDIPAIGAPAGQMDLQFGCETRVAPIR